MPSVLKTKVTPLALALTLIGTIIGVGITMASASTTYVRSYSLVKEFYSQPLKRCIRVSMWGKVTFRIKSSDRFAGRVANYVDRKIQDPTARVTVMNKCGAGAKLASVSKAELNQRWYDYRCGVDPGVSVGFPWSISIAPTAKCGSFRTANRTSSYGKGNTFTQHNSGRPVYWANGPDGSVVYATTGRGGGGHKTYPLCLGANATVKIWTGTNDDSWAVPDMKACVTK